MDFKKYYKEGQNSLNRPYVVLDPLYDPDVPIIEEENLFSKFYKNNFDIQKTIESEILNKLESNELELPKIKLKKASNNFFKKHQRGLNKFTKRLSSLITDFANFLLVLLKDGIPYPFSQSIINKVILNTFSLNEDYMFTNKFDFLVFDPDALVSKIITGLQNISFSTESIKEFVKSLLDFGEADLVRKLVNYIFSFIDVRNLLQYYEIEYKLLHKEEKKIIKDHKMLHKIFLSSFYNSIIFRFYLDNINGLKLAEVKTERIDGVPFYYFTQVDTTDSININFFDNKRGSIIRLLEEWRNRAFYRRDNGFFISDISKGIVFRNQLSKSKWNAFIIPLVPRKIAFNDKFTKKHFKKRLKALRNFFVNSNSNRILYPKIALYDLFPTTISINDFSNNDSNLIQYDVTFAISDIEIGRIF